MRWMNTLVAVAAASMLWGCASENEQESSEELSDTSALTASGCGADYAVALAHYTNAVNWSKDRLRHGTCEWNEGFLWDIADEASRAVMTCGAFRETIRTSPWAAPLRQALAPSLNLRSFTGELQVIRDSQWQNWTGVETFFLEGGLSFWAAGVGAYGPGVRIDFGANGEATWGQLRHNPTTDEIYWESTPASYTIEQNGHVAGRILRIQHGNQEDSFVLGVENAAQYRDASTFTLTPMGGELPVLYSLVRECDA